MPVPKSHNPFSRRDLLSALALFPAARILSGQQTSTSKEAPPAEHQPQSSFSTDVKVVNVLATVRNKSGKILNDLQQTDFSIDESGRPQTIKYFSRETNLPLTLGLLVDTSGSQRRVLSDERTASYKFIDQVLREDRDLAFVLHFDFEVELLEDLTNQRGKLQQALDLLQVGDRSNQQQQGGTGGNGGGGYPGGGGGYPGGGYPGGGYPGGGRRGGGYPGGGRRAGGGTKLYDAVLLASDEVLHKQQGRKAIILLTDGVDQGSKVTIFQAIAAAQKADTLIYPVLFSDSSAYSPVSFGGPMGGRRRGYPGGGYPGGGGERADGKKVLQQMAQETGGRFFQVSHSHPLDKIYAEIEEDLRNQYSIGFTPDQPGSPGVYHQIHLATKAKNAIVYAREGYWS